MVQCRVYLCYSYVLFASESNLTVRINPVPDYHETGGHLNEKEKYFLSPTVIVVLL
jgi:hypothetical protein